MTAVPSAERKASTAILPRNRSASSSTLRSLAVFLDCCPRHFPHALEGSHQRCDLDRLRCPEDEAALDFGKLLQKIDSHTVWKVDSARAANVCGSESATNAAASDPEGEALRAKKNALRTGLRT